MKYYKKILALGYRDAVLSILGEELASKVVEVSPRDKSIFLNLLRQYVGKRIFAEDKKYIKSLFEHYGCKVRYCGIGTLNGQLDDRYPDFEYRFVNQDSEGKPLKDNRRKLENGEPNPHKDHCYWILQKAESTQESNIVSCEIGGKLEMGDAV